MPPDGAEPSNYPRPNLAPDRQVLRDVAAAQRLIVFCLLGQIVVAVFNGVTYSGIIVSQMICDGMAALVVLVLMILSAHRLTKALGESTLYVALMFLPGVSFLALLVLWWKAAIYLRRARVRAELRGANPGPPSRDS